MPYTDPTFEQRRASLLKGTPQASPTTGGFSSGGGFVDQTFESRRKQIYSTPAQPIAPVSATPTPAPAQPTFLQKTQASASKLGSSVLSGLGEFAQQVERKVQGLFTPKDGSPFEIVMPKPKQIGPIKLTPEQTENIGTLKVGDKLPGFDLDVKESAPSAQLTPEAKKKASEMTFGNVIDNIFNKPADYILNNTGFFGEGIKKTASDIYNNPIETLTPGGSILKTLEKHSPETYKKLQENPIYKFEEAGFQGIIQGALRVYANWNPRVQSFLDEEVKATGGKGDAEIAGNTVGNIIGTIGSFVLGGEVVAALKFGKVALPATFAALGQTSLPADTPVEARLRNLVVDTVSGTLLEYIKPLNNLRKMGMFEKGAEYTKQLAKSMTVLSGQVYLDARSVGASDEQAKEMVKDSALILLGLHGFMIAGKAGQYATRSSFKEGSAVFTPDQARGIVVGSNIEGTKLGNAIMKASLEAEAIGKNIQLDMTAAKKSGVAKALRLETPNGIAITKIEYVDAVKQPKIGSAEKAPSGQEAPPVKPEVPPTKPGEIVKTETPPVTKPASDLTGKVRVPPTFSNAVEEKAFNKIVADPQKAVDEYIKAFENEVSPDLALTQFEGYEGHNAGELSRASGTMKSLVYDDLLKTQQGIKNNTVLITAGGSGSGKTTAVQAGGDEPLKEKYPIIVDTTFSNNSAIKDIQKALDNDYKVHITYTFRDPAEAWVDGALKRVGEEGRVVSEGYFLRSHLDANRNIIKAYNKFKDTENVQFDFYRNVSGKGISEVSFDNISKHLYNRDTLATAIEEATDKAYEQKQITKQQYKSLTEDRSELESGVSTGVQKGNEQKVPQEARESRGTTETALRVSESGYSPSEPWFYKEGAKPLTPPEIKLEAQNDVSLLDGEKADSELEFWLPKGKISEKSLNELAKIKRADLKETTARYEEIVEKGMDAITDPNPDEMTLNTALSLTHNHVYHNEYVLALIDRNKNPDQFMSKHPPVEPIVQAEMPELSGGGVLKKPPIKYDYQSTQLNLPEFMSKEMLDFAKKIPEDKLQIDEKENQFGIEKEPHITVLYGLDNKVTAQEIENAIAGTPPITAKFGKVSMFENEKFDVLKVDIESPELMAINEKIAREFSTPGQTFTDYQPHATLAYLKKGEGAKYVGDTTFEGKTVQLDNLTFSKNTGEMIDIPLAKSGDQSAWMPTEGRELSIAPSLADTPEKVVEEAQKLGLPPEVIKNTFNRGSSGTRITGYVRPKIGKAEFKILVDNSTELRDNPVLTVDAEKNLVFDGERVHFTIKPDALQIKTDALTEGDKIRIDLDKLKGTTQQMRIRDQKGNVLGFNPKNLEDPFSEVATEEVKKIVKQSEIAKFLSEKLNVPIRRGKFRHAGAIGVYKPGQKVVRIKSGGLNTIFHEVAHYLDDTIGFSDAIPVTERKNLMQEYGYTYEGQPAKQKKEAFAEYMRFRMTGQTEKIADWSPEFDKIFNEKIKQMPDVDSVINTASEDFKRWNAQPATSKILSHLSIGGQGKGSFKDRAIQTMHDLYTSGLDDLHPLDEFSKLASKKLGKVDAVNDPYVLARNLRGWVGKADLFLNKGTFRKDFWSTDKRGKIKMNFTGKGYSEIMKPVERMKALDDFRVYIVAQRVVNDLAPRKIKTGISLTDAKTALEELNKKYPEFEQIAKERREFNDRLLEYAKDNGVIGEEGLKKIKEVNAYHVPFYRVMEESGAKFLGKSKMGGNIGNPIKKIKGSEREIIDPLESDVKNVYAIINAAERNNIGIAMANISSQNFELGRLFEEVAKPMKPITVNVKEVMEKAVKGTDAEDLEIPEELAEAVVTLFRTTYATGPNMLNVNMGDKQKVFEVDPDLFKAIQGLNIEDVGIIMKILSAPAKLLRAGATLSPDFSVRNPLRDQFTAFAYSKHGFIPGVDLVRGMFELLRKGDTYNLWKAGGGEHAMFVSLDRVELQKGLKDVLSDPNLKDTVVDVVKNPLKVLQIVSELGEAGTRLGEMRNALARGVDPVESAFASRNITLDFSRIGAKTRGFNAIVAFFNANVQGTDAMIRNFKERPFQTLWKVLLGITLPSILLYLANRDDPRWKEIPQWQKNLFWIVMTPNHIYRIPKPFELGVLFGSVPERALEVMDTKDPEKFNELKNAIAGGFTPGFLPTALIPVIENITNYSFFMDRPIVNRGQEALPPAQQAGPYTTEVSKLLGEALNYSPAKIDNLVAGYSGGLGKYAQQGLDKVLLGTGIVVAPEKPAKTFEETPVVKAFMIREPIGTGSESVNQVYNKYASTNAELTYVKQLVKDEKTDEALEYVKKHPDAIDAITLTQVVNTFSTLNKAVDLIRQSEMDPQEKTDRIQKIQRLQTNLAQKALEEIKNRKNK